MAKIKQAQGPSKHHRAGHEVTLNPNGGTYHCLTCGHPILSCEQEAAPELLEACKHWQKLAHDAVHECRDIKFTIREDYEKLEKAIAKATG